ncbi:hypothetical protein CWI75_14325 [Kineobactrum sediminis]|uniref:Sulfotransferase n=1 Tax=Kineobactrum sediminis TaxID=1905677 RepID=A0A2N5XZR6_9GAMM|nr:sulfotransferase [Kineobactrum sediminis]PLW81642.1 hypothetical protein CWI75_14325 [Kineobactrum sediminis]
MLTPYRDLLDSHGSPYYECAAHVPDPVAVGGVGGSGTRVINQLLAELGFCMATPMNDAGDALEWPPLDKLLAPCAHGMEARDPDFFRALNVLDGLLALRRHNLGATLRSGWKVPSTFLWLTGLAEFFPQMQYIHLIRNGLDMAYSGNQRQVRRWSAKFGINGDHGAGDRMPPALMLEYWLRANKFVLDTGPELLGNRFLLVRYEALCLNPEKEIRRLCAFLETDIESTRLQLLASRITPPASLHRYRKARWQEDFSTQQLQRVQALGYTP